MKYLSYSLCADGEDNISGREGLKIKDFSPAILFDDTSNAPSVGKRDWQLNANGGFSDPDEFFAIEDITASTTPFQITGTAPDNTLYVAADGKIGLGTSLPQSDLHLQAGSTLGITLEAGNGTDFRYRLFANSQFFGITDETPGASSLGAVRFAIFRGTPVAALLLEESRAVFNDLQLDVNFLVRGQSGTVIFGDGETGNVGVGTSSPDAPFEVSSDTSFTFFRLTAEDAPVNQNVDMVYTKGPDDRGQLRYNIVESGDSPQIPEMTLNADGDMELSGMLITAGSCAVGCDAVFDDDYALKSIEEHQAQMWSAGYLPHVGPTPEDGPFNVSDKMGRMLNELEHAHIYIGQQQARIDTLEANAHSDRDTMTELHDRLAALEAQLAR